ncbi:DUF3016 domain-containing protein [Opitutaceae bacterium EW11]|nr:DUF3016 domain-containing protein [Opitutaceae bacterium EW11]
MKTKLTLLLAVLALAGGLRAADSDTSKADRVDVQFQNPEKFTDVKDTYMGTDRGRDAYLEMFKEYLQSRAPRYLADGQKLTITFTDIDMAGDFEPQRGPSAQDIRILKAIYPPRLKFNYRVTDAQGAVVKEGSETLTNLDYQNDIGTSLDRSDSLRYEKRLLDDWMSRELRARKK